MTEIKICGITRPYDAQLACEYGAKMIGMIFYDKSPRFISNSVAEKIVRILPEDVLPVGVFVNPTIEEVNPVVEATGIKALQIHADFVIEELRKLNLPLIQAYSISNKSDFDSLRRNGSDYFLLDNKELNSYGGTGRTFDWELIPTDLRKDRMILAGGINVENVADAISKIKPAFLDISSGVESSPGIKDRMKLEQLFSAVEKANDRLY
ncbi:MAG: phosphoribosylanthranilate isomerase [Candidatus Marinimicrobia bacterium]|nr:phosphoribosylanthranilate isomerase [Candidatus Neomarinimicrobiota bacterium]